MKDYSKYFEHPEAFIISINIIKDDIEVTFSNQVVNLYPLTDTNLKFLYEQLEMQYQEVSENWKEVNKTKKTSINLSVIIISMLVGVLSTFGCSNLSSEMMDIMTKGMMIAIPLADILIIAKSNKKINKHGEFLKNMLSHLNEMETVLDEEEANIERVLSKKGILELKREESLVESGYIDNSININTIDKWSQREREEIYSQYRINEGLKNTPKVLTRKRETDKK